MSVLKSIEAKIEGLFEGVFGRAFRTHVQPVELARKLAKEMDEHRAVSVSRVYVPNEYSIYLSTADRDQFSSYEGSLVGELQEYLVEHARRESYVTITPPRVIMKTDDDLAIGEFGIATRTVEPQGAPRPEAPPAPAESGQTMIYRSRAPVETQAVSLEELGVERERVTLTVNGSEHELTQRSVVLGRSRESDVRVDDPNVSRRHAEIRQEGATYWLVDLDSTNGTEVNGRRVSRAKLADGDTIVLGGTEIVFGRRLP
jgi:hypothetical protein